MVYVHLVLPVVVRAPDGEAGRDKAVWMGRVFLSLVWRIV